MSCNLLSSSLFVNWASKIATVAHSTDLHCISDSAVLSLTKIVSVADRRINDYRSTVV